MKSDYRNLLSPLTVRNMTLKNRVAMTPMGTNYAEQNGEMSFLHINYYEQRAKGGTGLIIVENTCVDFPLGYNGTTQLRIDSDNFMPRLFKLCENVHRHGAAIAIQLNHAGASAVASRINAQPVSASDVPTKDGGDIPRPLMREEIEAIARKYGEAARRAQIAGFDAVEIHAGHSYLISQFLSPITNKRTDEFGGSPENRARFAAMVIEEVRKAVGPSFPIIVRISADEFAEGGNTLQDSIEYLRFFEKEVDMFDVSAGLNSSIQYQIDANHLADGWRAYLSRAIKDEFGKPVFIMGNIRDPKVAEDILVRGDADMIGIGRGLIADPEYVNKVISGREDEIRKCISCNIGCAGNRIGVNRPIRCTVNPCVNETEDYREVELLRPCNVVVIGGGTAGLEAACTAAEAGCTAFLIEKNSQTGGLAAEISKIPDKNRLGDFPQYLRNRASKLRNLFILNDTEADAALVRKLNPDIIVNATGSVPLLPPVKGLRENISIEGTKVYSILDMIENLSSYPEDLSGKKVVVIGGGAVGLDVVEFFAPRNADVSIVEMQPVIGRDIDPVSKSDINALMKRYGVRKMPDTALLEVRPGEFIVRNSGEEKTLEFDYGFVCLGMRANNPVLEELRAEFENDDVEIISIGDSVRARRIIEGVSEGRNIINVLRNRKFIK